MKTRKTLPTIVVALLFIFATRLAAQEKMNELIDFKVIVEKTDDEIKLSSEEGCAWVDLSFSLNNYQPQAVDEYGMTALKNVSELKDENLSDFLFTITTTKDGIALKGIEGTAWTKLNFTLANNEKQAINQYGMTSLE